MPNLFNLDLARLFYLQGSAAARSAKIGSSAPEDDFFRISVGTELIIDPTATEGYGALTLADISAPENGTLTLDENGAIVYTPNEDFSGTEFLTYTNGGGIGRIAIHVGESAAGEFGAIIKGPISLMVAAFLFRLLGM